MADSLPWMKFYPRETLADGSFSGWSLEERGAWLTLIFHNWIEGSIPSDQPSLGRLLHTDPGTTRGLWSAIGSRFVPHPDMPGRLTSPRLEIEREAGVRRMKKLSEAGTKAIKARWLKVKQKHTKRIRDVYEPNTDGVRINTNPDPDPATDPDPASAADQPTNGGLAGESVNLRAFRERLTEALGLPALIRIAKPEEAQRVADFFDAQLGAVGPDWLLRDCMAAVAKSSTGTPASLRWFKPWLENLHTPKAKGTP